MFFRRYITICLVLFIGMVISGCRFFDSSPATTSGTDSARVQPVIQDSLLRPPASVETDSAQLAREATLDSLRRQLDAIQTSIAALSVADSSQRTSANSTVAAAGGDSTRSASEDSMAASDPPALQEQLDDAVGGVQHLGLRIFSSIALLFVFYFLIRGSVWLLDQLSERSATQRLFFKKLVPIFRIVMWMVAGYVVIVYIFDVTQSGLLSAWTAVGVAVGFASQDVLKNIFGGLIIIVDQPFQVGDKINIGGTYGEVVSIGLRSTRIVTPDDNLVSVPNAQVVESQVANANAGALDCQVVVDLYLPAWVDVVEAKTIAYSAAANSKYVYLEKPIVVNVKDEFRETFLTHFVVKAYVLDTRYEFSFASDVTETAKVEFQRRGFLPPLVQMQSLQIVNPANGARDTDMELP